MFITLTPCPSLLCQIWSFLYTFQSPAAASIWKFLFFVSGHKFSKMENVSSNVTGNFSKSQSLIGQTSITYFALIDFITFLVGQPMIIRILWITVTSKKAIDVLNFNLALICNLQHWVYIVHFFFLLLLPESHNIVLRFLFTYAEIGGPVNLSFICFERYVAVIYPTSYHLLKKHRFREVCVVAVWLLSVPLAFVSVFAARFLSPLRKKIYEIVSVSWLAVLGITVLYSSISIAQVLKKSSPGTDKIHPRKKRAFKCIRATLLTVLICYVPVTYMQRVTEDYNTKTSMCMFLLSVASIVHLLLYLSTHGKLFTCTRQEKKGSWFTVDDPLLFI